MQAAIRCCGIPTATIVLTVLRSARVGSYFLRPCPRPAPPWLGTDSLLSSDQAVEGAPVRCPVELAGADSLGALHDQVSVRWRDLAGKAGASVGHVCDHGSAAAQERIEHYI